MQDLKTYLAWTFTHVISGTFKREKKDFKHHNYPILAPLPTNNTKTLPIEGSDKVGPFVYFVLSEDGSVCYIGKCKECNVIKRWVRPGVGGPASHYWTHSTKSGGCVFNIAKGIIDGAGSYSLRFATLSDLMKAYGKKLGIPELLDESMQLSMMEDCLINFYSPLWNQA